METTKAERRETIARKTRMHKIDGRSFLTAYNNAILRRAEAQKRIDAKAARAAKEGAA